jgi:hypothetical protein
MPCEAGEPKVPAKSGWCSCFWLATGSGSRISDVLEIQLAVL